MQANLNESWRIGPVEVPSRLVLAPMAGVSVQAFRRQGRRFGAGLVCSIVDSVAGAVGVPVTVKMRRGLENGSRTCLDVGPRLVDAGAQSLTLHPRSARQMYTGSADHSLTAELVERVDVPIVASGD